MTSGMRAIGGSAAKEVDERIDDPARRPIPAEDECNRNGENDAASQTQDHALARHVHVQPKPVRGQLPPKRSPDIDRTGDESGADDARERDELPKQDNQAPRQQSKSQAAQVGPKSRGMTACRPTLCCAGRHRELRPGLSFARRSAGRREACLAGRLRRRPRISISSPRLRWTPAVAG